MDLNKRVRVRFAPSPTGPLHIGGVRTALFNYLFAKQNNGDFLLRIEDTDSNRFVPGAEEYIIETFKWLGLEFDEGVGVGGEHGPYRQSERKIIYKEYVKQLLDTDLAYYAFDTPEELDAMRKELEEKKASSQQYDSTTRLGMHNSLSLSKEETQQLLDKNIPYVVRIKVEPGETILVNDIIRGEVRVMSDILDDKVLYKSSDELPTYHLANIVDDHLMEISHVIRGEEWLPSAPLHVLLYRYLGWEETMPKFAHLPLLLKPDGNGKLSKRDGDRLGFPVFPLQWEDPITKIISSGYREQGYYPDAVVNMLAFLGWNPGTEQEIFSLEDLVKAFNLNKVSKSGAKFSIDKAHWFNHYYLQNKTIAELVEDFKPIIRDKGYETAAVNAKLERIIELTKERVSFISNLWDQTYFFFEQPTTYEEKVVKKRWTEDMPSILKIWCAGANKTDFSVSSLENLTQELIGKNSWNAGKLYNCIRLALVGAGVGPHLFDIIDILGKEESFARINKAIDIIK